VKVGRQVDHRKPFAQLGPTDLWNCGLLCKRHHDMKTYLGWVLARAEDGTWSFTPPDDYRDPEPPDPAVDGTVFYSPWTGRAAEPSPDRPAATGGVDGKAMSGSRSAPIGQEDSRAEQLALAGAAGPAL
jgi:hypothetical protein